MVVMQNRIIAYAQIMQQYIKARDLKLISKQMKHYLDMEGDIFEQEKVQNELDSFQQEIVSMLDSDKIMKEETIGDVRKIITRNLRQRQ